MNFSRRLTASISALLLAAITPACVGTPIDVSETQEAETSEASDAIVTKAQALQMAVTSVVRNNPTVRGKFAQALTNRIPQAPILSVLGDRVQLLISVKDLVEDSLVKPTILAEAGGALTNNDIVELAPEVYQVVTLTSDLYESILAQYEYVGLTTAYNVETFDYIGMTYEEMFDLSAVHMGGAAVAIGVATLVVGAAGVAVAAAGVGVAAGALGWSIGTWLWEQGDADGDDVPNGKDDYPYDSSRQKASSIRFPPWLEGGSIYAPLAFDAQWATDFTGRLFTRFVPPGANAIDPVHANTMIQSSPGPVVTFAGGPQARLAFLP